VLSGGSSTLVGEALDGRGAAQEVLRFLEGLRGDIETSGSLEGRLQEDLGLDSVHRLELLSWLSDRGVETDLDAAQALRTVTDIAALLVGVPVGSVVRAAGPAASRARQPRPLHLRNDRVTMRPVRSDDLGFLYDLATADEVAFRWRFRGAIPTFEAFQASLTQGVLTQLVVTSAKDMRSLGEVVVYNANQTHRIAYVAGVFIPDLHLTGVAAEAFQLFVRYVFQAWDFRKLYMETPAYNFDQISSGAGRWFEIEGVLKDFTYLDGRYWDEYILAITRPPDGSLASS
jgi:RimJ/RimL family protein N-acetyltransferase/acyl carrier protein